MKGFERKNQFFLFADRLKVETQDNKTGGMLPFPGGYCLLLSSARFTVYM